MMTAPRRFSDARARPVHLRPALVLLVMAGGSVGTLIRFGLSRALPWAGVGWPWATFTANITGALLLGLLLGSLSVIGDSSRRRAVQLTLGTGLLGGYTTYSTFAVETMRLGGHSLLLAAVYGLVSVVSGFAAALAGTWLASRMVELRGGTRR